MKKTKRPAKKRIKLFPKRFFLKQSFSFLNLSSLKHPAIIFSLLFLLFSVSGCFSLNGNKNPPSFTKENICTNNNGLKISFMDNMPPSEIFEREKFYVGVLLENKGCFPINKGFVTLGGYEEDMTEITDGARQEILNMLQGQTIYSPEGGRAEMIFEANNKQIRFDSSEASETFSVNACYEYSTKATAQICVNPNRPDTLGIRTDVCKQNSISLDSVQGAPVMITKIRPKTIRAGNKVIITFDIYIKNIGNGNVRDFSGGTCLGNASVYLTKASFSKYSTENTGDYVINCSPKKIIIRNNEDNNLFRCTAELFDASEAYSTILSLEIDYAYSITADKSMLIRKAE